MYVGVCQQEEDQTEQQRIPPVAGIDPREGEHQQHADAIVASMYRVLKKRQAAEEEQAAEPDRKRSRKRKIATAKKAIATPANFSTTGLL